MSSCGQSARATLNRNTFPVAVHVLSRHRGILEREAYVVGHEEIEMSIPVIVKKTTARPPACLIGSLIVRVVVPKTGSLGHIGKCPIPVIAMQAVLPEVGTKDVLESVVVVIADADTGRPSYSL